MKERLLKYWGQLKEYWGRYNRRTKIMVIGTFVLIFIALFSMVFLFSRTQYSYAFTDLSANDAAAITNYLKTQGVPYKLSADGKSIGVPSKQASQVKINVESQGLMKNGSLGYGIFRNNISALGMTDNEFNVLKVDALAGEIQQVLDNMNGVSGSKVIINLPQQSLFLNDNKESSSAVVVVKFKLGYRPDQLQIDTMYNLVRHSVPNLPIDNITISDQNGELLPSSKTGGLNSVNGNATDQFQIKQQIENNIQKNVYHLLSTILGPNKVVVSVVASLNFDQEKSHQQLVTPVDKKDNTGIAISAEKISKTYSGSAGSGAGGVPGTGQNAIPGYPSANSNNGKSSSEEYDNKVNYDVNRITNDIISSPYKVTDLTINVAVQPPNKNDPNSLTPSVISQIKQMLVNVVSASLSNAGQSFTGAELANKVTVIEHNFDGLPVVPKPNAFAQSWVYALGGLLVAALGFGGFMLFRRRKPDVEEEELSAVETPHVPVEDIEFEQNSRESQVRKQLESLARKQPEDFVNLLRTWLADE